MLRGHARRDAVVAAVVMGLFLLGLARVPVGRAASTRADDGSLRLRGADAGVVAPSLLVTWAYGYNADHPTVKFDYTLTSAPNDISRWTAGKADFAINEAVLTAAQQRAALAHCSSDVMSVPIAVDAQVIAYNLPHVGARIMLSPDVLTRIFLGDIREWNDTLIQRANPGVRLPHLPILPVYRSDGSDATNLLSQYLVKISAPWRERVGMGVRVNWPVGRAAVGSLGVAARVLATPGAIGYVDLADARAHHLSAAALHNQAGQDVAPSIISVGVAAESTVASMPASLQQDISDVRAAGAYPLTSYIYVDLCRRYASERDRQVVGFVRYLVTGGQAAAAKDFYTPLPARVQSRVLQELDTLTAPPAAKPTPITFTVG